MNVHELSLASYLDLSCSLLVPVLRGESFNANGGGFEQSSNAWITGVLHICAERLDFQLMPWMWLHCCQTNFSPKINDRGIVLYDKNRILKYEKFYITISKWRWLFYVCVFVSEVFMSRCCTVSWTYVLSAKFPKLMVSIDAFLLMWVKLFFWLTSKDVFFYSLPKNRHA